MGNFGRCVHMEVGLPRDEEVRHFDHMVTQEEWRELTGTDDELHLFDHNISQAASRVLRHGLCYRPFPINALGNVPVVEIYGLIRDSRANLGRVRAHGPSG